MIFTDRTIKVKKGASSIEDPIVLYRRDKEVEIRFTLSESSPFRFGVGAEPNIIEKTEAAYGQLIIKTPNDLPSIFSEIAPTNEGKIIFTITAEMIDEITEVGNYTFQIRLFDESMNSRATLPEVVNGIEIREPIATEDVTDTNEVGVATVGYALTTTGTPEDTFDSQGNYNKTTWGTGDRITDAKLNKMEAAIDGVNQKVASVDLSGYVTKEDPEFTGSLSMNRKADTTVGHRSITLGDNNEASGQYSFAEGKDTTASGNYSHSEGFNTKASSENQHVQGKYNIEDATNTYAHIVGNGTSDTARSNAHTLDWSGNGWYAGKLSQEGTPTEDKDLVTKKYVDGQISTVPRFVNGTILAYVDEDNILERSEIQEKLIEALNYAASSQPGVNTIPPNEMDSRIKNLVLSLKNVLIELRKTINISGDIFIPGGAVSFNLYVSSEYTRISFITSNKYYMVNCYLSEDHDYEEHSELMVSKSEVADVAFSGSYNDLFNKPTKLSEFTNDSGFTTKTYVDDAIKNIEITGGSNINDTTASANTTYSGNKIETIKEDLNSQIRNIDLSNYVEKVQGKGLSTNDYTTAEKQKLEGLSNYDDTSIREAINNKANKDEFYYNYKQAKAKNAVAIFLDDTTEHLYTYRERFKTRGIKITGALRLDGVSDSGFDLDVGLGAPITYAHVKELQDDFGIDFAYHGTKHGMYWGTTWSISEDIDAFLASTEQHGINIYGYIGPNGAPLPDNRKDKFLWRRNSLKGSGSITGKPTLFFNPEDHINIDNISNDSFLQSVKGAIDALSNKTGHVLSLSGHIPTVIELDNFWNLIDYILEKGIDIITATEARMRYGYAIARLPEKVMIDDIINLLGKGNYTLPNYFAMTENGVIKSNYCPVRWIDVSNINTPNANSINNFEFGTTIVSGGSLGNLSGVPSIGTTFINRYGKNDEDFMLHRAYNDAGLFFRDVKTRQRWDKIGIVSTTVPTSPTATGYVGEMAVDANYLYVCVASNSWIRIAKDSTWE